MYLSYKLFIFENYMMCDKSMQSQIMSYCHELYKIMWHREDAGNRGT